MALSQKAFCPSSRGLARKGIVVRVAPARLCVYARESRIGSKVIPIPKGVTVTVDGLTLKVKGPKGEMTRTFLPAVKLEQDAGTLKVSKAEDTRFAMAQHGLTRILKRSWSAAQTLASNMVVGVSDGFSKVMELVGTGFRAAVTGSDLTLNVGYCKPRVLAIPAGLKVTVEKNTTLTVSGFDKCAVGEFCAVIRRNRPPEPYKGKGVRYQGEVIKLKEGKAGGKKK